MCSEICVLLFVILSQCHTSALIVEPTLTTLGSLDNNVPKLNQYIVEIVY